MNYSEDRVVDEFLVMRCQTGDTTALSALITKWQPPFLRYAAVMTRKQDLSGPVPEPTITDEIPETFQGRHRWLMILSLFKTGLLGLLLCFCVYQFFQQETIMAMIAYASMTVISIVGYTCLILFLWIQMNHNTTVREIKRLELQLLMLIKHFKEKE